MAPDRPRIRTLLIVLALTAAALATRVAFLDADPARFKRVNELFDEGYWALRDASRAIAAAAPPETVIVGALAHTLALDNHTKPVWYTPRRALNRLLNPDLARFDVRLVLTVSPPSAFFPDAEDYPLRLTPVGRLAVYPAPHLVGTPPAKAVLTLYRRTD